MRAMNLVILEPLGKGKQKTALHKSMRLLLNTEWRKMISCAVSIEVILNAYIQNCTERL